MRKNPLKGITAETVETVTIKRRSAAITENARLEVPRDKNSEFEPKIIEKRQTRTDEIEQKIMVMYAKGMPQRDIERIR